MFSDEKKAVNLECALKDQKKLLPWVFETDNSDALKLLVENTKVTKAKLKTWYLEPAKAAGAQKCLAYIETVSV